MTRDRQLHLHPLTQLVAEMTLSLTLGLDMPPVKQPVTLLAACQDALEKEVLSGNCSQKRLEELGEIIPYPHAEDFLHKMLVNLNDQDLSPLFTSKIKSLQLNGKSTIRNCEKYYSGRWVEYVVKCINLQKLEISGSGSLERNCDIQIKEILLKIDCTRELQSIKLKNFGSELLVNNPEIAKEFWMKLLTLEKLEELELSEVSMDETCLKILLNLKKLISLSLLNSNLTSIQVLQILTGLPRLRYLDIIYRRQSKVVQALSTLPGGTKLNLKHLTFRQPPRPSFYAQETLRTIRNISSVKVIWNIFETGYSSSIDEGLMMLEKLENIDQIHFEVTMLNMLYIIQLGAKLQNIAQNITRFDFYEPELVHPASLDFCGSLPNLQSLTIINPTAIGDDMFLEMPDLCPAPFPRLVELVYEGDTNTRVLDYLTTAPRLVSLELRCGASVLDPLCLKNLHIEPKESLTRLSVELVVETSGDQFVQEMKKIVENSPALIKLGNVFSWNNVAKEDVKNFQKWILSKNYDVNID